jgi:hypothetical protein
MVALIVIVFGVVVGGALVSNWLLFEGNRRGWWSNDDVDKLRRP